MLIFQVLKKEKDWFYKSQPSHIMQKTWACTDLLQPQKNDDFLNGKINFALSNS